MKCKCGNDYVKKHNYEDVCFECCEKDIVEYHQNWILNAEPKKDNNHVNAYYNSIIGGHKAKMKRHKERMAICFICGDKITGDNKVKLCTICSPYWICNREREGKTFPRDERIIKTREEVIQFHENMARIDKQIEEEINAKIQL